MACRPKARGCLVSPGQSCQRGHSRRFWSVMTTALLLSGREDIALRKDCQQTEDGSGMSASYAPMAQFQGLDPSALQESQALRPAVSPHQTHFLSIQFSS